MSVLHAVSDAPLPSGGHAVVTRAVADLGPLLARLPAAGALAWVRDGDGLVGLGEADSLEVTGPDRFEAAAAWWEAWLAGADVDDPLAVPGTGPVAFASFSFDAAGTSRLVVPAMVLGRRDGRCFVTTVGATRDAPPPPRSPRGAGAIRYSTGSLSPLGWEQSVHEAVSRIAAGELDKVVLARDLVATAERDIDAAAVLAALAGSYPSCWTFAVDGLVGATPELLIRRLGDHVASRVLAGTLARTADPQRDTDRADALLASAKDLEEHRHAVDSVSAALEPFCRALDVPAEPRLLALPNVWHLATDVVGRLRSDVGVLDLAAALHPTAAVAGTPTTTALGLIAELEGLDRGRYAGPVGWVGADGDGELGIALRCARLDGPRARLFAGCGIVAGSDPAAELAETQWKFVPLRDALEAPVG